MVLQRFRGSFYRLSATHPSPPRSIIVDKKTQADPDPVSYFHVVFLEQANVRTYCAYSPRVHTYVLAAKTEKNKLKAFVT